MLLELVVIGLVVALCMALNSMQQQNANFRPRYPQNYRKSWITDYMKQCTTPRMPVKPYKTPGIVNTPFRSTALVIEEPTPYRSDFSYKETPDLLNYTPCLSYKPIK